MVHQDSKIEIEMKRIRNQFDYKPRAKDLSKQSKDSITVQGDTLSIADMLMRLSQGVPITGGKHGNYLEGQDEETMHNEPDYDEVGRLDINEQNELLQEAQRVTEKVKEARTKKVTKKDVQEIEKPTEEPTNKGVESDLEK